MIGFGTITDDVEITGDCEVTNLVLTLSEVVLLEMIST